MSKTLVIGATGQIGQLLVHKMCAAAMPVGVTVRNLNTCNFDEGVEVRQLDLEAKFNAELLEGYNKIVFTAGSGAATGFDKTLLIDLWAAVKMIDLAKDCRVEHFVMVSSRGALDPDNGPKRIKPYLIAKHFADSHLRQSGIPYTLLQPGRLLNEPPSGRVTTERPEDPAAQIISREDVADVIVRCLQFPQALQKTLELFGGDQPIAEILPASP